VRVPASTSNLGPGFDLLGVALSPRLEVERLEPAPEHRFASLEGEASAWPAPAKNLFVRAHDLARGEAGDRDRGGFAFRVHSEIPLARGLGSSGAAIAAGLLLGADGRVPRERLFALGLELEGHPDNLTPALFGGARICVPRKGAAPLILPLEVHASIGWALAWPEVQVPTEAARAALPRRVDFADAVENPRRLALLLAGLARGDAELLAAGVEDRLHVERRLALLPGSRAVLEAARAAGAWAATLSGSGSAHVALGPLDRADAVAAAMADAWRKLTGAGTGRVVSIVADAPELVDEGRAQRGA